MSDDRLNKHTHQVNSQRAKSGALVLDRAGRLTFNRAVEKPDPYQDH